MKNGHGISTIACIGAGPIGRAWMQLFLRHGHEVRTFDPSINVPAEIPEKARRCNELQDAVSGADLVIESIPEQLAVKQQLCRELDGTLGPHTLFFSSSSAIPVSQFTAGCDFAARSLVAHPFNPPDIVPLVELVPASFTSADTIDRADALLRSCEREPVRLHKETTGFVGNRLAMALYREALSLIGEGVIDVDGLEQVVKRGLAPRWCCAGPSETYHLNQDQSFADYFERIAQHLDELVGALDTGPGLHPLGLQRVSAHQDSRRESLRSRRARRNASLREILMTSQNGSKA